MKLKTALWVTAAVVVAYLVYKRAGGSGPNALGAIDNSGILAGIGAQDGSLAGVTS